MFLTHLQIHMHCVHNIPCLKIVWNPTNCNPTIEKTNFYTELFEETLKNSYPESKFLVRDWGWVYSQLWHRVVVLARTSIWLQIAYL